MTAQKFGWRSPSNIALIKYWGKKPVQVPANASISFTLSRSYTETFLTLEESSHAKGFEFDFFLDGEAKPSFKPKIKQLLERLGEAVDFLRGQRFKLESHNSFPHSSGIASSASGMSALALCLMSAKQSLIGSEVSEDAFFRQASDWARLGSGSASRSLYGPLAVWGQHPDIENSSDQWAVPYRESVHPIFTEFRDYILLVEKGQKAVSSTVGHGLMDGHPFAQARFMQAERHLKDIKSILASGDLPAFGAMVESEALTLHAMMQSSQPYYLLMRPNTLAIIEKLWALRKEKDLPLYFTLDAGANVHLLFPKDYEQAVKDWVDSDIRALLDHGDYICDQVGSGPLSLSV